MNDGGNETVIPFDGPAAVVGSVVKTKRPFKCITATFAKCESHKKKTIAVLAFERDGHAVVVLFLKQYRVATARRYRFYTLLSRNMADGEIADDYFTT